MGNFTRSLKKSILTLTVFALVLLVANIGQAQTTVVIGAGVTTNGNTAEPAPFQDYFKNSKHQILIKGTELTTAGLTAGASINKIGWIINTIGTSSLEEGYTISYKWTTLAALTTTYVTGTTTVYGPTNFTPSATGNVDFTLASSLSNWNGTDDLIIQVCEGLTTGAFTVNCISPYTAQTFNSYVYGRSDATAQCPITTGTTSLNRPNTRLTYTPAPAAPANPTITAGPSCATGATLTASGSAPGGVTWYWQGTNATGTSTASPASSTYNAPSTGTYYIRAQNNTTLAWSVASGSVVVTFPAGPAAPAAPTGTSPACGSTTLTAGAAAGGTTNYWQGTTVGGVSTASNAAIPLAVSSSGTYYLNARDNTTQCWSTDASKAVVINALPAAPTAPVGASVCVGAVTANVSATGAAGPLGSFTQTISFTVAGQPTETNAAPGNTVASAAFTALPSGSTVTSATLAYNNITALGGSWQADVRLGLGSAITDAALVGTGAANAAGAFNYTRALPAGTLTAIASAVSGTVNLLYWDALSDNAGAEATFPTGAAVATLTINYTAPSALAVQWYDASTNGNLQGTGNPYNTIGSTVLPTAGTPGTYSFYGGSVDANGCKSASRIQADVVVNPVLGTVTPINLTCNGSGNGSFSFAATCGTAPFTYKVDGVGAFGAIPTNLTAGSHSVIVKDNGGFTSNSINFTLTQPAAVAPPTLPVGSNVCIGTNPINISATGSPTGPVGSFTQTISFTVSGQPTETTAAPGNTVASAAFTALPSGATVTSATLAYSNITALGSSWQADVRLGLGSAITAAAAAGTGAANSAGAFNYTRALPAGTLTAIASAVSGTVILLYWDNVSDNAGVEATFPTGASVATLTINYTAPSPLAIQWYDAATNGNLQGTGNPYNTYGSTLVGTALTPGTYSFYGGSVDASGCKSATRAKADVVISGTSVVLTGNNLTCFGAGNGSISLTSVICGTAPLTYSINGGGYVSSLPTNLAAGTYTVLVKDNTGAISVPYNVVITQPAVVADPVSATGVNVCSGVLTANLSAVAGGSGTQTISFNVASQPTETNTAPGVTMASAAFTAIPVGSTVTSATLTYNGINALGGSWQSEVRLGFGGAFTDAAAAGTGAANSSGTFNYTRALSAGSLTAIAAAASGTLNLLYWNSSNDNVGDEDVIPTGTAVATLVITYTSGNTIRWYDASTGGNLVGTGSPFNAVGTTVLPNTSTPGTYNFFAASYNGTCNSANRLPANVTVSTVVAALTGVNVTCNGYANGTFTLGVVTCGTTPFTYSVNGGAYGPIPTNLGPGTYSVIIKDFNGNTAPSTNIIITEPTAETTAPTAAVNATVCKGAASATVSVTPGLWAPAQLLYYISNQTVASAAVNFNIIIPNLGPSATVTNTYLYLANVNSINGSWLSELRIALSGATTLATSSLSATGSSGTLTPNPGTIALPNITNAGGTIAVTLSESYDDIGVSDATWGTVGILVYANNVSSPVSWWTAPTGGTQIGTGASFNPVGTAALPNTNTPGVYTVYAQADGITACSNLNRLPVTVTVIAPATANVGSATATICSNTPHTVAGATATQYSSILWTKTGGTGVLSNETTLSPTYTPSVGESGTVILTLTAYGNTPCSNASDTKTLTIISAPTATITAPTETTCSNVPFTVSDATATNYLSVNWTDNGTGAFTANQTALNPTYTPNINQSGTTTLVLHVNANAPCADITASKDLDITTRPTASAGAASANICSNTPHLVTGATATNYSSVGWTHNGLGTITNGTTLGPTYTPSVGETGSVILTLTAYGNSPCADATDTKTLNITPAPTATPGIDATICSNGTYNVTDAVAANYASVLWSENGTGSLTAGTTISPTYNPSVGESDVVTLNLHINGNGNCADIDVQQSLTVIPAATANAGAATGTICNNLPYNVIAASASNYSSILWTHNGTGALSNGSTLSPTYTPGVGETGAVTLLLTAYGNTPCTDATDNIVLTINPIPNFTTTQTNVSCFGGNDGTITVTTTVGSTPFDFSKNGGTNYTSNQTSPFTFSTLSSNSYSMVVRDNNGCVSLPQVVTITQPVSGLTTTVTNSGPYSAGQTITLTSSPSGGTTAYGYSWSGPLTYTSATGPVAVRTGATTGMAGIYKVTVTDANGCTASAQTTVNVYAGTVWTGAFDTDWHNPLNWSPTNVPDLCIENVVITNVTNKPIVNTNVNVGNVTMNAGGQITLNADLGVCGKWTGNTGAVVLGNNAVVFNGSSAQNISGITRFTNVRLDNIAGASVVGGASQIVNALELKTGTLTVNAAGYLTFISTSATQCAVIDNFSAGMNGTLVGAVKMQRYYNAPTSPTFKTQHYMGSPANAIAYTMFGANGTEGYVINPTCDELKSGAGSPSGNMAQYEEDAPGAAICDLQGWKIIKTGNTENGRGYSVSRSSAGTLTISGTPNLLSSYTRTGLTNSNWSNTTLQGHIDTSGWHILSNPWLANLELNTSGGAGMDNQVAVWQTTGPYAGGYKYYQIGFDVIDIAPFQAFLVHKTLVGGTAAFTINGADRVRTPSSVSFQSQSNDQQLVINVDNTNGLTDRTIVAFNSDASNGFDPVYDGNKLWGDPARQALYTDNNGMPMARNTLTSINATSTVEMGFDCGTSGTFNMNFEGLNTFDATSYITLEDRKTNTWHNVRNGNYVFAGDTNDNLSRFVIHFTPPAQVTKSDATCSAQGTINVIQPGTATWNYTVTNSSAVVIANGTLNNNLPIAVLASPDVYTISLVDNNNYTVVKQVQVNGAQQVIATFNTSTSTVEQDADVVFTSTATNATNNTWNFGDNATANGITATHSYATPGTYNATLTANNNDCNALSSQQITVTAKSTTGINNLTENKSIAIWGSDNTVYVDMSKQPKVEATIEIYNVLGQQLSNEKFGRSSIYTKQFDNLEAAYVIVRVKNNDEITTRKIFIAQSK